MRTSENKSHYNHGYPNVVCLSNFAHDIIYSNLHMSCIGRLTIDSVYQIDVARHQRLPSPVKIYT